MIIPRIKYFADRDYAGLGEGAKKYLRAKRNELAQDLIRARKEGKSISRAYELADKENFRKKAESVDRDLKSIEPRLIKRAKNRIKWAVGDESYSRNLTSGNVREIKKVNDRTRNKLFVDPLLENKETRAGRAAALRAKRSAKQPVVQPKASYVKPESVVKPKVVKEVQNKGREELVKTLRAKKALGKNLKKVGYVGLGVAGAAGLAVGAKKLYDRNKQAQQ